MVLPDTEYNLSLRTRAKAKVIQWGINVVLLFVILPSLAMAPNRRIKIQFLMAGSIIAAAGHVAKSLDQDSRILSNDIEAAARQSRRQNLYDWFTRKPIVNTESLLTEGVKTTEIVDTKIKPIVDVSIEEPIDDSLFYFDIKEAYTRHDMPHMKVVAPSGSGKSVYLQWQADLAKEEGYEVTVLTPHIVDRSEFEGYNIISNDKQIYDFIDQLATDMKKRYSLQPWNEYAHKFPKKAIIIDEAVTLFESFKVFDKDYEMDVQKSWVKLLVEARKVGIKIILATQSNRVDAIGLKGRGDVTDCLLTVLLGKSAKRRVTTLLKKGEWTDSQAKLARSNKYFAIIDDGESNRLLPIPDMS